MNRWYVYLDDCRKFIPENTKEYIWSCYVHGLSIPIVVRDYNSMIDTLNELREHGDEIILDLDHDLGTGKNGYDLCKWIVEENYPIIAFHIHSMNPVGRHNMHALLTHYNYNEF